MYRAIIDFVDLQDNRYLYKKGDEYPRKGYEPDAERLAGLQSRQNKARRPLIVEIPTSEPKTPEKSVKTAQRGRKRSK